MLLEFSCPPAPQALSSMYHRVIFVENNSDLDAGYVWLGTRLSSNLIFICEMWWVDQLLSKVPASSKTLSPCDS